MIEVKEILTGDISSKDSLAGGLDTVIGLTPNIQVGKVETLEPSEAATVILSEDSTKTNPVFDFAIPRGEKGEKGNAGSVKFKVVNSFPEYDIDESAIYLIQISEEDNNKYYEFIYVDGQWEMLGGTGVNVEIEDYAKLGDVYEITGDKEDLETEDNSNLVLAINEVNRKLVEKSYVDESIAVAIGIALEGEY